MRSETTLEFLWGWMAIPLETQLRAVFLVARTESYAPLAVL